MQEQCLELYFIGVTEMIVDLHNNFVINEYEIEQGTKGWANLALSWVSPHTHHNKNVPRKNGNGIERLILLCPSPFLKN